MMPKNDTMKKAPEKIQPAKKQPAKKRSSPMYMSDRKLTIYMAPERQGTLRAVMAIKHVDNVSSYFQQLLDEDAEKFNLVNIDAEIDRYKDAIAALEAHRAKMAPAQN